MASPHDIQPPDRCPPIAGELGHRAVGPELVADKGAGERGAVDNLELVNPPWWGWIFLCFLLGAFAAWYGEDYWGWQPAVAVVGSGAAIMAVYAILAWLQDARRNRVLRFRRLLGYQILYALFSLVLVGPWAYFLVGGYIASQADRVPDLLTRMVVGGLMGAGIALVAVIISCWGQGRSNGQSPPEVPSESDNTEPGAVSPGGTSEFGERAEMIEFLRESKADLDAGRTVPAREFLQSLGRDVKREEPPAPPQDRD